MKTYAELETASVLEIGAQNVNGSLRSGALPTTDYTGIDIEDGEGVDIVAAPGEDWPVADAHFDLVMASSVFEHDKAFWRTFLQMCRKAKPGGFIYISAPSNGKVHRYPQDFWRFYPDAGLALEELARSEGIEVRLIESFIAERQADEWNDFCAVFRREPSASPLPASFMWEQVACTNALTWQSEEVRNARENTEDQILMRRESENLGHLQRASESERATWNAEREMLARTAAETRIECEKSGLLLNEARAHADREAKAREDAEAKFADLRRELQNREHRIADLESNLRQRQEEIAQAWDQVEELKEQASESEELGRKLAEAEEWVYKLAGERRQAEQLSTKYKRELRKERERRAAEEARSRQLLGEIEQLAIVTELLQESEAKVEIATRDADETRKAAQSESETLQDSLDKRFQELATLTKLLGQQQERGHRTEGQIGWLLALNESLGKQPRWWNLLPRSFGRRRTLRRLRDADLFDGEAYLRRNPDVASAGADPLIHYLRHGMHEGRSPTN